MVLHSIANQVRRLRADERGAVSVMMGFLIIPLVGSLALGFEVSNWYMITRGMQNAADAAAVSAATNGGATFSLRFTTPWGGTFFFLLTDFFFTEDFFSPPMPWVGPPLFSAAIFSFLSSF